MYEIGKVYFHLFEANDFHVKAKNERLTAGGSHCCHNLKHNNLTLSFGRLHNNIAPKSAPHM